MSKMCTYHTSCSHGSREIVTSGSKCYTSSSYKSTTQKADKGWKQNVLILYTSYCRGTFTLAGGKDLLFQFNHSIVGRQNVRKIFKEGWFLEQKPKRYVWRQYLESEFLGSAIIISDFYCHTVVSQSLSPMTDFYQPCSGMVIMMAHIHYYDFLLLPFCLYDLSNK